MIKTYEVYIGIDCAPGRPRPITFTEKVKDILGVESIGEVSSMCFGAWTWYFDVELDESEVDAKREEIQKYFESIYAKGFVRGTEHYIKEK